MGHFAYELAAYVQEFYALNVVLDKDRKPKWVCRVMPDGSRDLRTSYDTKGEVEVEPDFRKIWK